MEDDEIASLVRDLERGLTEVGLTPLVDQERALVAEGRVEKLTEEDVADLRREWSLERGGRRAPSISADEVRVTPLSIGDRLAELLDLIEVAVGGSYAIEVSLRDEIKSAFETEEHSDDVDEPEEWQMAATPQAWNGEISFGDPSEVEDAGATPGEWTLATQSALEQRESAVRQVLALVYQLRQLSGSARSARLAVIPDINRDHDRDMPGGW